MKLRLAVLKSEASGAVFDQEDVDEVGERSPGPAVGYIRQRNAEKSSGEAASADARRVRREAAPAAFL